MLRLNLHQPTEPFWVEFADLGVRLQLRPHRRCHPRA
jgi:hypothetical protein